MRLTDIAIRALPLPAKGQKTYWDEVLHSFGCRVSQGGTKSFVVQHGDDRQLVTIGRFPIISLGQAREEAKRILAERTLGKRRPKTARWDDALKDYLKACEEKNRGRTVADYTRLLNRHFPFKQKQLAELTHEDIERRLEKIAAPSERNHALAAVKIFLAWCQRPPRRYVPSNPCEGMVPTKRRSRRRVLSDAELAAVFCTALKGEDSFSHIVALLCLTGQRRSEIGGLRWAWVDQEEGTITLPDTFTKNGVEHTFPYGRLAKGVFERITRLESPYVFPASRGHVKGKPTTCFNGWAKAKPEFDKRCGVTNWTLHDIRRTFGTKLAELKVSPHVIERLLNHKLGSSGAGGVLSSVAQTYNRYTYLPEMVQAITTWQAKLTALALKRAA